MGFENSSGSDYLDLKSTNKISLVAPLVLAPAGEEKKKPVPTSGEPIALQLSSDLTMRQPQAGEGQITAHRRVKFEEEKKEQALMSGIAMFEKYGVGALSWDTRADSRKWTRIFKEDGTMAEMIRPSEYKDISPIVMSLARKGDTLVQSGTLPIHLPSDIQAAYFGLLVSIAPRVLIGSIDLLDKYPKISEMYPTLRTKTVNKNCWENRDILDLAEKGVTAVSPKLDMFDLIAREIQTGNPGTPVEHAAAFGYADLKSQQIKSAIAASCSNGKAEQLFQAQISK